MSDKPSSSIVKLVVFASLVTLVVTCLRLYGELQGWDPRYFSKEPGGRGALVGISWLMFVFGFWFGARVSRSGQGPASAGKALGLHAVAVAVLVGGFVVNVIVLKADFTTLPGLQQAILVNVGFSVVAALIALLAWPRLGLINLVYALLARIPVVVVTYIACDRQWGTHYEGLGPKNLQEPPMVKALWLSIPQVTLWPAMTIVFGGLFGALAALLFKPKAPPAQP
jgi:hypothetical protein